MSVEATNWVWKESRSRGAARLVLLAIADFGNEKHQAWPSMETLTKKTALGERTVHRAITELIKMGELRIEYNAGPRLCNLYQVVITPASLTPPSERHPRQSDTPADMAPPPSSAARGAIHDTKGVPERHPELSIEPPRNHQEPKPLSVVPTDRGVDRGAEDTIWTDYLNARGSIGLSTTVRFTPKRRDKIRTRLKTNTQADLQAAAWGWTRDPWPDRRHQCDATQIFRDDEQVEKFAALWRDGPPMIPSKTTTQAMRTSVAYRAVLADKETNGDRSGLGRVGRPVERGLPAPTD